MESSRISLGSGDDQARDFRTTHWSVVQLAGQPDGTQSAEALETLCRQYWYPLYAFARRHGLAAADAQDIVQAFFAQFLEKNYVARANRQLGRFRSFLLTSFKNFMYNERDRSQAVKRGGRVEILSRDALLAEDRYALEPAQTQSPDQIYDKSWAVATLERALARLRSQYFASGNGKLYESLKLHLWAEKGGESYAELATRLDTTEAGVKMAVMRLRRRCRESLRMEVARTVANPEEADEELRQLISILREG